MFDMNLKKQEFDFNSCYKIYSVLILEYLRFEVNRGI